MNLKKYKCSANYCSGVSCSAALTQSQLRLFYTGALQTCFQLSPLYFCQQLRTSVIFYLTLNITFFRRTILKG